MATQCTVLGAGSWGTALAIHLTRAGHSVHLWDRNPDRCDYMNQHRLNPRYLKEHPLPAGLTAMSDLKTAIKGANIIVPVVPSHALRETMILAKEAIGPDVQICCATKGIEANTLVTMYDLLIDVLGSSSRDRITMLYGPSFASEVAKGLPTAVAVAGNNHAAELAAEALHTDAFRAYHTDDVVGVCVGGSLKNVMAIACGIVDGLDMGQNARAAVITRGLAEITRLAVSMGANPLTMMGLAGMGDLVLTCTGNLSRNRRVGLALGQGRSLDDILQELGEVAEGVTTAKSAFELGEKMGTALPITAEIYKILYKNKPAKLAMMDLMTRERRAERDV